MTDNYESFDEANDTGDPVEPPEPQEKPKQEAEAEPKESKKDEKKSADSDAAREWQSRADREAARANKAEEELARLQRQMSVEGQQAAPRGNASRSEDAWVAASKDNFRDDLFNSDPRLKALGFDPALIQGSTPAEMRQSFVSLQGTVDRMETGIRNRVLVEHGLEPVPGSGERATGVNFRTMPTDEFNKLVDEALGG